MRSIHQAQYSEHLENERKRKFANEHSDVILASALLSLDTKRFRTALDIYRCSSMEYDSREFAVKVDRVKSFGERDMEDSPREPVENVGVNYTAFTPSKLHIRGGMHQIDHNELSSAMALASLVNSPPLERSKVSPVSFSYSPMLHPLPELRRPTFRNYIPPHYGNHRYFNHDPRLNGSNYVVPRQELYQRSYRFQTNFQYEETSFRTPNSTSTQVIISPTTSGVHNTPLIHDSSAEEEEKKYFRGIIPLGIPAADHEWLTEMYCYVRYSCVEAFSANEDDVKKSSKRGRIIENQVGIRCKFCSHTDVQEQQAMSAVSYPVSSTGIHESVKRWIKIHLCLCKYIPDDMKRKILDLEKSASKNTRRQYWVDSAKALGIEDTVGGLRFTRDVQDPNNIKIAEDILLNCIRVQQKEKEADLSDTILSSDRLVLPDDADHINPFFYHLLCQVEPCRFTEVDKYVARSRCVVGFRGFRCKHCSGIDGIGKYFPISKAALATNSTTQNLFSHILKCNECPNNIKEALTTMKLEMKKCLRRPAGRRQAFFDKVWIRLHGEDREFCFEE